MALTADTDNSCRTSSPNNDNDNDDDDDDDNNNNNNNKECESKGDTSNNNTGDWNHFKITQTIPEQRIGKARN